MFLSNMPRPMRLALYGMATGIVLFMCLAPSKEVPGSGLVWDKAAHALTWAILTSAGLILAPNRPRAITVFCLALGAAIEVAQATMGFGRQGDWRDLVADSIGVAIAVAGWLIIQRLRARGEPDCS